MPLPQRTHIYTIDDIYALPDGQRAELIDGQLYMMAPPTKNHQQILLSVSRKMDYYTKLFKYRTAGVREYWIVDPEKNRITVYNFESEDTTEYTFSDSVKVGIYKNLTIDFGLMKF